MDRRLNPPKSALVWKYLLKAEFEDGPREIESVLMTHKAAQEEAREHKIAGLEARVVVDWKAFEEIEKNKKRPNVNLKHIITHWPHNK